MVGQLSPYAILGIIAGYFLILVVISWWLNRGGSDNEDFFLAGRNSPWPLVALGMIGASLSGVTFISIPGAIGGGGVNQAFSYMQVVFGYLLGYLFIATVLLPLYYRMNLTSIYEYLEERLGRSAYKIGAFYFLLSRTIGASFRLFLVAIVLQQFVTGPLGIPFFGTVAITISLIWLYTFQGGIKTIVYTDALQTVCMLAAVMLTIGYIGEALETDLGGLVTMIRQSDYSQLFFFEGGWSDPNNFFKQFFSGALITIVMTGLDQDMMQKNLEHFQRAGCPEKHGFIQHYPRFCQLAFSGPRCALVPLCRQRRLRNSGGYRPALSHHRAAAFASGGGYFLHHRPHCGGLLFGR